MTAILDRSKLIVSVMTEHDLERFIRYLTEVRHLPAFHVVNSRRAVTARPAAVLRDRVRLARVQRLD